MICNLVIIKITTLILPGEIPQDGQRLRPDELMSAPFQCTDDGWHTK